MAYIRKSSERHARADSKELPQQSRLSTYVATRLMQPSDVLSDSVDGAIRCREQLYVSLTTKPAAISLLPLYRRLLDPAETYVDFFPTASHFYFALTCVKTKGIRSALL